MLRSLNLQDSETFKDYNILYKLSFRYTKILKDTILIKSNLIFIKVFKTLFLINSVTFNTKTYERYHIVSMT